MDMDMDSSDSSTSMSMMMMTPYLHFTSGDALFFKQITPSSGGAIAGATLVLFVFAILDRFIVARRNAMEVQWLHRAKLEADDSSKRTRTIIPFNLARDVLRGVMYALQAFVHYGLMLAVMTFQVAYIIGIIAGLGVGEMLFGRGGFSAH